jgi:hypothetical protein
VSITKKQQELVQFATASCLSKQGSQICDAQLINGPNTVTKQTTQTQKTIVNPEYVNPEVIDAIVARHMETVPIREILRVYTETAVTQFARMGRTNLKAHVEVNHPDLLPLFESSLTGPG